MEMNNKEERPYSYHTFLLPFEIEKKSDSKNNLCSKKEIEEILNQSYWKELIGDNFLAFKSIVFSSDEEKRAIEYNQEQYFHSNVKKAIHNDGKSGLVSEYVFRFSEKNLNQVIIENIGEDTDQKTNNKYCLKVSNVRIKIFNTGIGILILELYNDLYRDFKKVKEINELSRHISLPYIAKDSKYIACAQKLTWDFLCGGEKTYHFGQKNDMFWGEKSSREQIYMVDFLKSMIIKKECRAQYVVKPSLDDRMFTCCLIQNDYLSRLYSMDYIEESEKNCCEFRELSKRLYEYIYIDKEGSCTAATFSFRKNILNESLYHRWTEIGTIYGVSHTSLVAITGEGPFLETIITRPFLTQYVEMAILALIQRASILRFQKQLHGRMNSKKIQTLQSQYIDYRNQLHFFEVSSQEQGIELYELIRKQLYIEKEMQTLEKNLEILYEKSNVDIAGLFNRFGAFIGSIAVFSIVLDVMGFIVDRDIDKKFCSQFSLIKCELLGIFLVTVVIGGVAWKLIKRKDNFK